MRGVAPLDVCWTQGEHFLRYLPPSEVSNFSQNHDNHLRSCLADIIAMPVPDGVTNEVVQLPFREGRLGLWSAARLAPAAYWASRVCRRSMFVLRRCALSFSGSWKDPHLEHSVFGNPNTLPQCLQQMAWRCQSGPNSPTLTSAPRSPSIHRWESGLMVAISRIPLCTSVHLPPLSTDHQALRASQRGPDMSPASPQVRRPLSQPKSSARCSSSDCICPSTWMTDSANVEHGWMCSATTDPFGLVGGEQDHPDTQSVGFSEEVSEPTNALSEAHFGCWMALSWRIILQGDHLQRSSPQVLARSVQNRVENHIDGGVGGTRHAPRKRVENSVVTSTDVDQQGEVREEIGHVRQRRVD